mmetsp:Transcript_32703/g.63900  ORF Transcript_32703/g.63900 Transcript_32703/m.63900 type:complete len:209 (+) Transcript_32703:253-879(+)|eukprot:CAMPEP_0173392364 /NCGR_PEP_ID=MMETSP1356-20130122/19313_1 /TAXON_ID=77927 ORGANISM="Hemiselmis virescens, Strain PCC157" /NCGR_SAMPLE_ID=MMETSP1356 /ASSEMBLY_ACC=CAM_ASM_000847 /LENGTH=208 /DNA_ID=CAMNT_0014350135 /DNA_START=251 /DNA_END=877 /DNA_ORIENTATION=-
MAVAVQQVEEDGEEGANPPLVEGDFEACQAVCGGEGGAFSVDVVASEDRLVELFPPYKRQRQVIRLNIERLLLPKHRRKPVCVCLVLYDEAQPQGGHVERALHVPLAPNAPHELRLEPHPLALEDEQLFPDRERRAPPGEGGVESHRLLPLLHGPAAAAAPAAARLVRFVKVCSKKVCGGYVQGERFLQQCNVRAVPRWATPLDASAG